MKTWQLISFWVTDCMQKRWGVLERVGGERRDMKAVVKYVCSDTWTDGM